jgi:hypothetical protein
MNAIFFPRNDYPNNVEVCAHRLGKKMTYTECTDYFPQESVQIAELFKDNGIKASCFASQINGSSLNNVLKSYVDRGEIWADLYFYSEHTLPGAIVTEEQFLNDLNTLCLPFFIDTFGKKPIALSYANGNISYSEYAKPYFLGGRQSEVDYHTGYGEGYGNPDNIPYSIASYIAKRCSTRIYDSALPDNWDNALSAHIERIDQCLESGGWLNNFTHWHDVVNGRYGNHYDWYMEYVSKLKEYEESGDVYFSGYGEAVAYLVFRQMITKTVMYSPVGAESQKLIIRLEALNSLNLDADLLQIPISVKFSTVDTPLEGQTIRCDNNLISLGNNEYIVEIPYSEYAGAVIEKVTT